jgi:hypothetical protein
VAKFRLHLKIVIYNNPGVSIPPTDTSMLENELEAGSSTGEPVASTVSGNAEDPANVPKSDEVGRKAKLPPNQSKSPILDNKRVRNLQRASLEEVHSSDSSVAEIEGPAKGVEVYPKLVDDRVTDDDDYMCIEDDEQCLFMKKVRRWLRDVSELSEFSSGK